MRRSKVELPVGSALLDAMPPVRGEEDLQAVLARVVEAVAERLEVGAVVLNLYQPAWDDFQVTHIRLGGGQPGAAGHHQLMARLAAVVG